MNAIIDPFLEASWNSTPQPPILSPFKSVDAGNDSGSDNLAVLLPVLAVLAVALVVVTAFAVNKKNAKVHDVKVGDEHAPTLGLALDDFPTVTHHVRALNVSSGAQDLITGKAGREAGLDSGDEDGTIGHITIVAILLGAPGAVHDDPAHHSRSKFQELLEVNLTDKRDLNARVEFATDKPIVQHVARVASSSELAVLLVSRLDAEAANVDEGGYEVGVDDVGGQDLNEVL
ncbi:hypothetical protein HG530_003710 [Fusarium avenaceum]|nr:hypothetical protein HG530_003710 [Fusarium avenaceum]